MITFKQAVLMRFLNWLLGFTSLLLPLTMQAQDTTRTLSLDEVVVSVNKTEERKADIPQVITTIKQTDILFRNPSTTADVLQQLGAVYVQKSQQGGGSPVIRGFEANKVLLVVDGIRMNNAIYRAGHLQNSITVDPNIIDRLEVVPGAGSVQYGSDALGGVMAIYTRQPVLSTTQKPFVKAGGLLRYASANQEKSIHTNFNWGNQHWGFWSSVSYTNFEDLRKGNKGKGRFKNFGDNLFYVERVNNQDQLVANNNPNKQLFSGYQQADLMQKILFQPKQTMQHLLNVQFSQSSVIPRYDRLQNFTDQPRFAEWYYGPQVRFLSSYTFTDTKANRLYDQLRFTPAYQRIEESRYVRNFNNNFRDQNLEKVHIVSGNLDARKQLNKHELRYGTEYVWNKVKSAGLSKSILTNETDPLVSRYPNSSFATAGLYASHRISLLPNLILSDGVRLSYVNLQANFNPDYFGQELGKVEQQSTSFNYNLGLVWQLPQQFRLTGLVSSGFRNPNVDDLGRTFEQNNGTLIVANPNLKPEQIVYREFGIGKNLKNKGSISINGFYSTLTDAIVVRPFSINGSEAVMYQGEQFSTQANVNIGKARLYGFTAEAQYEFTPNVTARVNVSQTRGKDKTNQVPLDHIPPVFGQASLLYAKNNWQAETYWMMNGPKQLRDYSPSGEDNLNYAPAGGSPGWQTWNLKIAYQWSKSWTLQSGVENILDQNYRTFASGINAPGRNFILALRYITK
jgi:hemoglobin/transferrin/lactoferrin receptor protein